MYQSSLNVQTALAKDFGLDVNAAYGVCIKIIKDRRSLNGNIQEWINSSRFNPLSKVHVSGVLQQRSYADGVP